MPNERNWGPNGLGNVPSQEEMKHIRESSFEQNSKRKQYQNVREQ